MVAVPVNPAVLVWARAERGLSEDEAAKRLGIHPGELFLLERGEREPTLGELEGIARHYRIPLASLLMPDTLPAATSVRHKLQDFRTFEGITNSFLSEETIIAIEEAFFYLEALQDIRANNTSVVSSARLPIYRLTDDPQRVASLERQRIGISVEAQFEWASDREAFRRWRAAVESQGVFSYQLRLGNDDVRGFAIWDERQIPILVVDSSESVHSARTFTLWHEFAHLLLRMGGISNQNHRNAVERFCNRFAAHFLMPLHVFEREAYIERGADAVWSEYHVGNIAKRFKVSKSAVALHLEENGFAPDGFYEKLLSNWLVREQRKSTGRATHIEQHVNRLGVSYVSTILEALAEGSISKLDAYEITNIKPKYFADVRREVQVRQAEYDPPR